MNLYPQRTSAKQPSPKDKLLIRPLLARLCVRVSIATLRKNVAFVEECMNGHNRLQT